MKVITGLLILFISLSAKAVWHLELKDGTIFTLKSAPVRNGDLYHFEINNNTLKVRAKSVISLTSDEKHRERFLYSEANVLEKFTVAETIKTVVRIRSELHRDTGTLIHPDGYILTNNHLVKNNHTLTATLSDGKKYDLETIAKSTLFDLAILKIKVKEKKVFPYVRFGDERALTKTKKVYSFSTSGKSPWKEIETTLVNKAEFFGLEDGMIYQQYKLKMRADNTGSPMFNDSGHFIGIITQKTKSMRSKDVWFSTPISFIKTVMKNLNAYIHNPSNNPIKYNTIDGK